MIGVEKNEFTEALGNFLKKVADKNVSDDGKIQEGFGGDFSVEGAGEGWLNVKIQLINGAEEFEFNIDTADHKAMGDIEMEVKK